MGWFASIISLADQARAGRDFGQHDGRMFDPSREIWWNRTGENAWREVGGDIGHPS
jgi:hypothetical protein